MNNNMMNNQYNVSNIQENVSDIQENVNNVNIGKTNEEFKISRLENAINIDFYDSLFLKKFEKYNKQEKLLLYCRSGRRSLIGAKILEENGFKNIYDLKGGVISLSDSILNFSTLNN
jgi:rhodanese-related sulfurtransferase